MDVKDLKKLLEAVTEANLNEFTLETGEYKLTLKRGELLLNQSTYVPTAPVTTSVPSQAETAPIPAAVQALMPAREPEPAVKTNLLEVSAPIVGTFYAAATPDMPNFVKVGDKVSAGSVLCIIEAMKLMNEIEAETSGIIAEILVKNEDPVEYGQVLFRIDPS